MPSSSNQKIITQALKSLPHSKNLMNKLTMSNKLIKEM